MKVFISYAREPFNPARAEKVRLLADQLRLYDIEVLTDNDDPDPGPGWLNWMSQQIQSADHVLMVCSELYRRRYYDEDDSSSYGARYEGRIIRNRINILKDPSSKYVPILFEGDSPASIPVEMLDRSRYQVHSFSGDDPGFAGLIRLLTGRAIDPAADATRPRLLEFRIESAGEGVGYVVRLDCEGLGTAEDRFDGEPLRGKATADALRVIASGRDEREHLRFVGMQLWEGLVAGRVRELYLRAWRRGLTDGRIFHLRLTLPHELEELPWEAIYSEDDNSFLATREQFCVIRTGVGRFEPAPVRPDDWGRPSVLIVAPETPGLDLGREVRSISDQVAALGGAAEALVVEGRVTVGTLARTIQDRPWDVVHFAGHGRLNDKGAAELRMQLPEGGDHWVDADQFATLFNNAGVRLIVLNCCRAAAAGGTRTVAGLGPILIGRRASAVVAMQYEIADHVAIRFAEEFYRVLLTGRRPGRVDLAIESTRVALFQSPAADNQRGFITPSLFLAPGGERLFTLPKLARVEAGGRLPDPPTLGRSTTIGELTEVNRNSEEAGRQVPTELIEAIRERRCIPVLGPGLLSGPAFRDAEPPLRKLVLEAAKVSAYGEEADFELLNRAGDWLEPIIFHRICQFFRSERTRAHKLSKLLEETFRPWTPPEPIQALARWDVPGYICLTFDGLLERALKDLKPSRPFVALGVDDPAPTELDVPRLVNLCGVWGGQKSRAPALTERDFELLWDKLAKPPDWLMNLITAVEGRSLLFLGAHPRDPLARRLASQLYSEGLADAAGPIYFATVDQRPADVAYWKNLAIEWVDISPFALIQQVDDALSAKREASRS